MGAAQQDSAELPGRRGRGVLLQLALGLLALGLPAGCGKGQDEADSDAGGGSNPAAAASEDLGAPQWRDVTSASGVDFVLRAGAVPPTQILEVKGGGLALFDWNTDGQLDLFAPNGASLEAPERGNGARLFAGEPGLRFRDATQESGLDWAGWGMGAAVGDVDADGRDDVFVACFGADALLLNREGGWSQAPRAGVSAVDDWSTQGTFGDLDRDGDLDLYVTCYLEFDPAAPPPATQFLGLEVFGGPAGLEATPDRVFENRGDGTFVDRSESSGIRAVAPAHGLGAVIADLDLDGRADVLVGNDSMANFLFLGTREAWRFDEAAQRCGLARNGDGSDQATMGIAIADVNGDARPDVFTTNFARDTNTLWASRSERLWRDSTKGFGLSASGRDSVGWASLFGDFDLDGDEDLFLVNGHVYPDAVARQLDSARAQVPLYLVREGTRFLAADPATAPDVLAAATCDRGAVAGDLDGDGDLDLAIAELGGPLRVIENLAEGRSLNVSLVQPGRGNRHALGATVTLRTDAGEQVRFLAAGQGYQSASPATAAFGLGAAEPVELEIGWPDGGVDLVDVTGRLGALTVERGADFVRVR